MPRKCLKTGFYYQFALFLGLFCSNNLASAQADDNTAKKSRIANKGLKLTLKVCWN